MGEEPPEGLRYSFNAIGHEADIFKQAQLTADSGYHSEKNIELVFTEGIDFYILNNKFSKRDQCFADYEDYKERDRKELGQRSGSK